MRILQIINALTMGGAQFVVLDLARRAKNDGHQIEIVCFRDGSIGKILRQEGFTVHLLSERLLDLPAFFQLVALIKKFKPDIVHSHLFRATFWARLVCKLFMSVRLVTSIHGYETNSFHRVEKLLRRFSDHLVFPSRYLQDWYVANIRKLSRNECSVIYPGVNIKPLQQPESKSSVVRIGTLSRLHPVKGIDRLISACGVLKKKGVPFALVIGGEGRHHAELQALADKLGISADCRFTGEVSDQRVFLDDLDIFVAASRQEAFGIHVCEAMERALPIVGARVGGIPELIKHGETGLLFDGDNVGELALRLEQMINNPGFCRQAGLLGRERVESSFNRQIGIEKHLKIFSDLLVCRRHVHFVVSSSELGGGERLALGLMRNLLHRGWKVTATCAGSPLADEIDRAGISCSRVPMTAGGLFFFAKLIRDLICWRPQLISSHLNRASLMVGIVGKITGITTFSHIHGLNQKIYYQFSDYLIAVSHAVKNHLFTQKLHCDNIRVISNCIEKNALASRTFPARPLRIAITAKLHANKGHRWALEAIARHLNELNISQIDILGDGPEKANLESFCDSSPLRGRVVFHGFVHDPDILYPQID
ncbi:MAG: glycosyltransferase, partial [Erysipelotrichia bacterium]|nr:glycosyltransferase [Erysipelotrichia bacterium]